MINNFALLSYNNYKTTPKYSHIKGNVLCLLIRKLRQHVIIITRCIDYFITYITNRTYFPVTNFFISTETRSKNSTVSTTKCN